MKKTKLITALLSAALLLSLALTACSTVPEVEVLEINVSVLNGTTGFGAAKLISDAKGGKTSLKYNFTVETDAETIQKGFINGSVDIAALPTNAAAALYAKTDGGVKIAAVNTLGVLYLVSNGVEINSFADLKGKKVYSPAQNPAFILEAICRANELIPGEDITIDTSIAAPAELQKNVASGNIELAVLPEPMVTIAKSKNTSLVTALDLTEEWEKVYGENSLMQGCVVVRTAWAEAHPKELEEFLKDYEASVSFTNSDPSAAAAIIVETGVFAGAAPVAAKAIPNCNIVYMDKDDGIDTCLDKFFKALYDVNPKAIGGKLPDSGVYLSK